MMLMNEKQMEIRKQLEKDLVTLAQQYWIERIKISTPNFDLDYRLSDDGGIKLVSEKAVIRTLGKVTKVAIGVGQKYATFEEAEKAIKKYWSEYYKKVRSKRTDEMRAAEAKRQKRYRDKRKAEEERLEKLGRNQ